MAFKDYISCFSEYVPCEECNNPDTYGELCVKCGECGRTFNLYGICTNINEHPGSIFEEEK